MDGSVDVAGLCQQARQQLKEGMNAEAVASARQAVASDPRSADAQHVLGLGLCQLGSLAEGVAALEASVGLMPTSVTYRVNLAAARERAGHWDAARMQWQEVLKLDPVNARAMGALHAIDQRLGPQPTIQMPQQPAAPPPPQVRYDLAGNPMPVQPPPGYQQPPPPPGYQQQGYSQPGYQAPGYGTGAGYQAPGYGAGYQAQGSSYGAGADPGGWSFENVMAIITSPREYFASNRGFTNLGPPVVFLIIQYAVNLFGIMVGTAAASARMGSGTAYGAGVQIGGGLICGIPLAVIVLFVTAGILHLFVMMFGGQGGYAGTFRSAVYSSAPATFVNLVATLIVALLPVLAIVGGAINVGAAVWTFVLLTLALAEMHSIEAWKAFLAWFLPFAISCVAVLFLFVSVFGGIGNMIESIQSGSFRRPGYSNPYGNSPFGSPGMNRPSPFGGPGMNSPAPFGGPPGFGQPRFRTGPPMGGPGRF